MINGIGVVGWGVGGIEAEAGMLGQPVYFLTPDVVGVELTGKLREGVTATDLVLTVTEMLRKAKVVGKFVEFFGEGTASLAVPDRATIANMAPEYGATMGFFPVDEETIEYFARHRPHRGGDRRASRPTSRRRACSACRRQGEIDYTQVARARPVDASRRRSPGPKRPQDRIELGNVKSTFTALFSQAGRRERLRQEAATTSAKRFTTARRHRHRQRRRADRRDHVVHQHLEPERAARRRPAREEGGRERA